ncbi:hypothetical protein SO802_027802 [Lithocarpus litseifolius]|uniref:Uncharacterized protein n=1 Tax=Lithocarpus litseifolius TaxID=425828 RepID=A0AAW2BPK6_9ROSI
MNRSDHQSKTMAVAPSARKENVYMAKLAEQAQRYEEMVEFMEKKEESRNNEDHVFMIRDYRSKIESELLDTKLIPYATTGNSKVFYLKMKGE